MPPRKVKPIPNVLVSLILATGLSACSWGGLRQVECETKSVEKVPLSLSIPDPLKLDPVRWRILTPENIQQTWQEIQLSGNEVVLFAVTPSGYEQLAIDFALIRNHINQQRTVIMKYREYYEPASLSK